MTNGRIGRQDARTFYPVDRFFAQRAPVEVVWMLRRAGFHAELRVGITCSILMSDRRNPRGLTAMPIHWMCSFESGRGTLVYTYYMSDTNQRRMIAFLDAVADGDIDALPEVVDAMRLTDLDD